MIGSTNRRVGDEVDIDDVARELRPKIGSGLRLQHRVMPEQPICNEIEQLVDVVCRLQFNVEVHVDLFLVTAFDGYRTARLPANLLQAQRDYFGAHTYERTDKPRGEFFHTNWTGRGGNTASTTYNV